MKKNLLILLVIAIVPLFMGSCGYERIDAGHVGIKVNLYGNEKGVDNVTEVTGAQWFNPIKTEIYEFPTYVQNAVWTASETEGSEENEEFRVTSKDGLVAAFDVSLNYSVSPGKVVSIFKKYRKPLEELDATILRNYVREGFNTSALNYTAEELFEKRAQFQADAEEHIRSILEPEGFITEQIVLLNEIRLPESVKNNVEAKVNAKQIALQKEQELQQATADANKKIEDARGVAESMRIHADAERYAYEQKQRALTPLLVQQQFIEKWDGNYGTGNVFGQGPVLYKQIK
jgi:regulator of protease activity HflC (stomatin/prohibitin superfamily)